MRSESLPQAQPRSCRTRSTGPAHTLCSPTRLALGTAPARCPPSVTFPLVPLEGAWFPAHKHARLPSPVGKLLEASAAFPELPANKLNGF